MEENKTSHQFVDIELQQNSEPVDQKVEKTILSDKMKTKTNAQADIVSIENSKSSQEQRNFQEQVSWYICYFGICLIWICLIIHILYILFKA